jgi:hypothetical protein
VIASHSQRLGIGQRRWKREVSLSMRISGFSCKGWTAMPSLCNPKCGRPDGLQVAWRVCVQIRLAKRPLAAPSRR